MKEIRLLVIVENELGEFVVEKLMECLEKNGFREEIEFQISMETKTKWVE